MGKLFWDKKLSTTGPQTVRSKNVTNTGSRTTLYINILHISLRQFRFPGCAIPLLFGRTFFKKSLKIHIPPPPPCPSPQPPPHRPPCRPPRPPPRQPPCRTTCPFVFPSSFPGSTIVLTDEAPRCLAALPHTLMVRDRHWGEGGRVYKIKGILGYGIPYHGMVWHGYGILLNGMVWRMWEWSFWLVSGLIFSSSFFLNFVFLDKKFKMIFQSQVWKNYANSQENFREREFP